MKHETFELLNTVCNGMVRVAEMVRKDTREVFAAGDHIEAIKHFDVARRAVETIKEAREALDEIVQFMSREQVPDIMRRNDIKTITIEGVGRASITHRYSASILDKERGYEWLRENGHGGIITETVNSSTLSAFAKDLMTNHGVELPEDIFKVGMMAYTSITKK